QPGRPAPALSAMDRAVAPKRVTPARIGAAAVAVLVLGAGAYGYMRYGLSKTLAVSADKVTVSTVEQATFSDYVPVTGNVTPEDTVFLDTVDGGQGTEVLVEDGAAGAARAARSEEKNTPAEAHDR